MSVDAPAPPVTPVTPAPKKGTRVWMWLGIGCGLVLLLVLGTCAGIAFYVQRKAAQFEKNPTKAAAELAVRLNPDVELVSSTETELTVRNKKTGEVLTVDFEDAKEGRFTFRSKEGEATIDADADPSGEGGTLKVTGTGGETAVFSAGAGAGKVPEWVPMFADGDGVANYDLNTATEHAGTVSITTSAPVATVMAFYKTKLEAAGFEVQTMTLEGPTAGGTVTGTTAGQKRALNVVVSAADGKTHALVTFKETK
jgi:hypothetical protein